MKNVSSLKLLLCLGATIGSFITCPALAGNWSGSYVGAFGGGAWSEFRHGGGTDDSFIGGGDIGHNWQAGPIVLGVEGDFSTLDNHTGSNGIKFDEDWVTTARGRAGFAFGRFLPYATGGLAMTDTVSKVSGVGSDENVQPGYVVGVGFDTRLAGDWFARVEYLHDDVPSNDTTLGGTTVTGGSDNNNVRVGINYMF